MYEIISCKKYNELGVEKWKKEVKTLTYPIDNIPLVSFYCFEKNYGYVRMFDKDRWGYFVQWFRTKKEATLSMEEKGLSCIEGVSNA